jgi:WhiB family redox-sensing transcriptional regulator
VADIFPSWQRRAACLTGDARHMTDFFSGSERRQAKAKKICSMCVVRRRCLDYALEQEIDTGVWGGADDAERAAMRVVVPMAARRAPISAVS